MAWIKKIIGIPTKWKTTPIQAGLSSLLECKQKETSELQKKATKIINYIRENNERTGLHKEESQFVMIPKREAIKRWIRRSIENTHTSNDVRCTVKTLNEIMYSEGEFFKKAMKRSVKL